MSSFKKVEFTEFYNSTNLPAIKKDRYGLDSKSLMIDLLTNKLYILNPNNYITPLNTLYTDISGYYELKEDLAIVSSDLAIVSATASRAFNYKGKDLTITDPSQLPIKYPNAKNGDIYTIADMTDWVCVGDKKWEELGPGYEYILKHFIPSGCTASGLTGYITLNEWNKLVTICTTGVNNAIDTVIDDYNNAECQNFEELFNYTINTGANVSSINNILIGFTPNNNVSSNITFLSTNISNILEQSYLSTVNPSGNGEFKFDGTLSTNNNISGMNFYSTNLNLSEKLALIKTEINKL